MRMPPLPPLAAWSTSAATSAPPWPKLPPGTAGARAAGQRPSRPAGKPNRAAAPPGLREDWIQLPPAVPSGEVLATPSVRAAPPRTMPASNAVRLHHIPFRVPGIGRGAPGRTRASRPMVALAPRRTHVRVVEASIVARPRCGAPPCAVRVRRAARLMRRWLVGHGVMGVAMREVTSAVLQRHQLGRARRAQRVWPWRVVVSIGVPALVAAASCVVPAPGCAAAR